MGILLFLVEYTLCPHTRKENTKNRVKMGAFLHMYRLFAHTKTKNNTKMMVFLHISKVFYIGEDVSRLFH